MAEAVKRGQGAKKILDIGVGSGCIAVALAKNLPVTEIVGVEHSPQALELGITLYADLPRVQREALNLQVNGDTLTIEAQMNLEMPQGMEATHAE